MANPRRNSEQQQQLQNFISSLKHFLRKPHSLPFLLLFFLLLAWLILRVQFSYSPSIHPLHDLTSKSQWTQEDDKKANLVRFKSTLLPSPIRRDHRGWLLNPVSLALDSALPGGAVSCASVHLGEIRPGGLRGNHRHHGCNETFVIWGAKTLFRLENLQGGDEGYAEVIVGADEVAVATSPMGTAHALVNVDAVHTTFFIGCQDRKWRTILHRRGEGWLFWLDANRDGNGCNYPKTKNELHGCINDVLAMKDLLVNRFGFDSAHIQLLTDAPGSDALPTGLNIKNALGRMVDQAEAGDVLFFHYSGHGTRIPSVNPGHPFRQDEAIVPCDFNLITDVDFRQLVNRLPKGASFTILSDSCHSGGLIDKEKEQIGPNSLIHSNLETDAKHSASAAAAAKVIPHQSILHHLSSLTNIHTSDIGTHLLELFGGDSSLKFRLFEQEELLVKEDDGVLLSGCQANETSADMSPNQGGEKAYGAFSNAVQMVFKEEKNLEGKALSNREVVMMAREVLNSQGFVHQHPCLYCSDQNADAPFLWHHLDR